MKLSLTERPLYACLALENGLTVGTNNITFIFVPSTLAEGCKGAL